MTKTRPYQSDYASAAALMDALPALVKTRMEYLGLSYREVGRQAGVSFSTVHRFVDGGNDPSFRAARMLFRWLAASGPYSATEDGGR